ncbi:PepSY-associated TM helix domain-containing protein [Alienimonas californiensis]|uniref:PepSY-associated TM helix n=1 Tax=Alienimonas californiensis TaxID=2527989 RepID=A0A517PB59_9PLAN|nr:PepSY-associated TM helix domain-containing protein [Alienimonas californiensis]QDT16613.1 hypothetical protein CA12_27190 [Alienimonas californiensis]
MNKKLLYAVHGWLGLNFGLALFVICLSGTIAVLSHELDWLSNPVVRAAPRPSRVSYGEMYESVRAAFPDNRIKNMWGPVGPRFACEFWIDSDKGETVRVYVDPYTGETLGTAPWFNTQRFFRDFHRRFFWYSWWGIWLVGAFGFVLLGSSATGLLFYKRWWAKLITLRVGKGLRVFCSDLHRALGVWTLLFALLISLTGVWYLVEIPLGWASRGERPRPPKVSEEVLDDLPPDAERLPLDELLAGVQRVAPEFQVRAIFFPNRPNAPMQVHGQETAWLVRDRANHLYVDPYTGEILSRQRAEELDALARWADTADPLHFGDFGGLTSKLIWFGFGLALSALIPTGVYLWIKRRDQIAGGVVARERRREAGGDAHSLVKALCDATRRRTAVGSLSTTALFALAAYATWEALARQAREAPEGAWQALGGTGPILIYGTFLLSVLVASIFWYRVAWFYAPGIPVARSSADPAPKGDG